MAATPTPINDIGSGRDALQAGSLTVTIRNPAQANACLILSVERDVTADVAVTCAITDDKGNTWKQNTTSGAVAATLTTNNQGLWLFHANNVIAGTQVITVTFGDSSGGTVSCRCHEFYNVDVSATPVRAFGSLNGTGALTIPSFTPTAGDLVYQFGTDVGVATPNYSSGLTKGTGFTEITADRQAGTFSQYSTTATNATFSHPGVDSWSSIAIALKPHATGTTPPSPGIRVLKSEFQQFDATSTVRQVPCRGNLCVINWTSPDVSLTVTDSNNNKWTSVGIATAANGLINQMLYAQNASGTGPPITSADMTVTLTYSGVSAGLNGMTFYDISGAATFAFDCSTTTTGNNPNAGDVAGGTITPTSINGLIINGLAVFWHTLTAVTTPVGAVMTSVLNPLNNNDPSDGCTNLTGTAASTLWEDDGHAHLLNADLATVTFNYQNTSSNTCTANKGVGNWSSVSAAFKAAPLEGGSNVTRAQRIEASYW